ncbi:MAG: hypothetical protein Q6373_016795 [Candidatus Sigynarchaeota archaeon]
MLKTKKGWTLENATEEHRKLYYLISRYSSTNSTGTQGEVWLKELPLRVFMFEGILNHVFGGYDYSPMSVELPGGRRYLNISQEGEDDIADLRELGLIACLKLSTTTYITVNAYRITSEKSNLIIPEEFKAQVDKLITCPKCGDLLETDIVQDPDDEDNLILIFCKKAGCAYKRYSGITRIEDVSYETSPYLPDIPFFNNLDDIDRRDA